MSGRQAPGQTINDTLNLVPDHLRGLDRFEAREKVVAEITALYQGLSERSTDQVQRDRRELVEAIRSND